VAYEETRRTDSTQDDDKSSNNSDIIEDPFDTPDTMNQQTTSTLTTQGSITGAQPWSNHATTNTTVPKKLSRRVNFEDPKNPAITTQMRNDIPSIDAITTLFKTIRVKLTMKSEK
jgi:hypothetical protein